MDVWHAQKVRPSRPAPADLGDEATKAPLMSKAGVCTSPALSTASTGVPSPAAASTGAPSPAGDASLLEHSRQVSLHAVDELAPQHRDAVYLASTEDSPGGSCDEDLVDKDGTHWVKIVGTGVPSTSAMPEEERVKRAGGKFRTISRAHHRMLERRYLPEGQRPPPKMSDLEAQLAEVKALWKAKYGEDLDADEAVDQALRTQKYSEDLDADEDLHADEVDHEFLLALHKNLGIVNRAIYRQRCGQYLDADEEWEDDEIDEDGMFLLHRNLTRLNRAVHRHQTGERLDLDEVGEVEGDEAGEVGEVGEEGPVEEDGTRWVVTAGTGVPSASAASEERAKQAGGKFRTLSRRHHKMLERLYPHLYKPREGAEEGGAASSSHLSELEKGLLWQQLRSEVKHTYLQKFGRDVDDDPVL